MTPQKINCEQAKQADLVSYLETLNIRPAKVSGNDYWYYSPFHEERTPSFKINRRLNVWYDHSIGKGGNLVDFGIAYHQCSVAELLEKLNTGQNLLHTFSFHQPNKNHNETGIKKEAIMKNTDSILKTSIGNSSNSVAKRKNLNDANMKNFVGIRKNNPINENKRIQTNMHENESIRTKANDFERGQTKMKILAVKTLQNERLKNYIESRGIHYPTARFYCKEVLVAINQRQYALPGFAGLRQ